MWNQYLPLWGLLIGTALKVLVPYVRTGLEDVAESGTFKSWPVFDYRYLAMFLLPLMEFGVAFLTIDGLWQTMLTWRLIPSVAMAWSGADLGKELVKGAAAVYKLAANRR